LAVSHTVYLDDELLGDTDMNLMAADLAPGMTYTWRVDETQDDGTVIEGNTWTFTTLPLEAHFPSPADAAEDVASPVTLRWTTGKNTIINDVYYGTDEALVEARDPNTFMGKFVDASYPAGDVELFMTYYWAVDAFTPTGTVPGPVWSFSTERYVAIADSITLNYDNTAEPYVSEAAIDTVADLTEGGAVSDLTLNFQGMGSNLSVDEETGTYMVTGEGADVWGGSDQFHYVYMQLTGDGEISARVVSNGTGSNTWAKGGVMIRESNAANSRHMIMAMTGGDGNGICFQGRAETGANSSGLQGGPVAAPPTYVKITRTGNDISGYYSADDGETWELFDAPVDDSGGFGISNPQTIDFPETVLIGLFVTSHADGENRTYTFDNLDIQGDVDGVLVSEDIDSVSGNSAEPVYVALEDVNGIVAMVTHPYPAATQIAANRPWTIPLSAFEGVDVTNAAKMYVGVGNGEPGGKGAVTFSDIKVVEEAPAGPKDVTAPGDIIQGVPNDGDWPGGEYPALSIDNNVNTKYLHFKGDFDPDPNTGGAGIRITPLEGPSNVTGLSFTTANDVPGRDPIAFKLLGSNESIDGPYKLIAEGDIVDFNEPNEWPRFTKNETPITFANQMAYKHYELIFTAIRGPVGGSVNSMQIAEIELLGAITTPRTLTLSSTNSGSVTTPGEGSFIYADGAKVQLNTKVTEQYYYFLHWTGSGADAGKVANLQSGNTTIVMDGDYNLKANFSALNFSLVTTSSTPGGSVTIPGEGVTVVYGDTVIQLKAVADPNYEFVNWTGSAVDADAVSDPDSSDTLIHVNKDLNVMAHFVRSTYTLTISSTAGGSVTTPGEGAMVYDAGSEVSIVATPDEHYHFIGWTGTAVDAGKVADPGCASTTVTVDGDYTLVANFEIDKHTLTICSNNGGSVTTPGEGEFEYDYGTVVDLEATPDTDYRFKYWEGPVADENSACTTVTITEDITVKAIFVKHPCIVVEPIVDP
jgi:hypothetical protein